MIITIEKEHETVVDAVLLVDNNKELEGGKQGKWYLD